MIWKPKNPYAGKKFPLLIGSAEWWEDDKVGLGEFDENTVEEKEITDSDTDEEKEAELGKHIQVKFIFYLLVQNYNLLMLHIDKYGTFFLDIFI